MPNGGARLLPRALLAGVVDYAGLFPPATLAMAPAVRRYAADRRGPARWMLGRFVVPAARLEEFEAAALDLLPAGAEEVAWRLSVIAGAGVSADLARAAAFNARHAAGSGAGRAVIDAVEWRAPDVAALGAAAEARTRQLPGAALYAELPPGGDARTFAAAARAHGLRLKLRTGGIAADAFPAPAAVLDFIATCFEYDVAGKLTAGLHHVLRGEYALTYEPGSARATMFGLANVLAAAALLGAGHAPAAVAPVLEERDPAAFAWPGGGVRWRGLAADAGAVAAARARTLVGFGSCAFDEPVGELRALGWWPGDE